MDADEHLNDEQIKAIKKLSRLPVRKNSAACSGVAFGKKFSYGHLHPDWGSRLFPKKSVTWVGKVHIHPECQLLLVKLQGTITGISLETNDNLYDIINANKVLNMIWIMY